MIFSEGYEGIAAGSVRLIAAGGEISNVLLYQSASNARGNSLVYVNLATAERQRREMESRVLAGFSRESRILEAIALNPISNGESPTLSEESPDEDIAVADEGGSEALPNLGSLLSDHYR